MCTTSSNPLRFGSSSESISSLENENALLTLELQKAIEMRQTDEMHAYLELQDALRERDEMHASIILLTTEIKATLLKVDQNHEVIRIMDYQATISDLHQTVETLRKGACNIIIVEGDTDMTERKQPEQIEETIDVAEQLDEVILFPSDAMWDHANQVTQREAEAMLAAPDRCKTSRAFEQDPLALQGAMANERRTHFCTHFFRTLLSILLMAFLVLVGWSASYKFHVRTAFETESASLQLQLACNTSLADVTESLMTDCDKRVSLGLIRQELEFETSISEMRASWNISCARRIVSTRIAAEDGAFAQLAALDRSHTTRFENLEREFASKLPATVGAYSQDCDSYPLPPVIGSWRLWSS